MSRPLFPNSVAYRPDGEPWAYAPFALELLTTPAVRTGSAYPTRPIYKFSTDANGAFATDLTISTPETGAWLWRLWWPDRRYIDAYIEQGDGAAIEIDDWVTLAGLSGSEAGTPQGEFLNGLYTAVSGAADGQMLQTESGDLILIDTPQGMPEPGSDGLWARFVASAVGSWLQATTVGAALFAAVDAAAGRAALGAAASAGSGTAGELMVSDATGNSVRAGYTASQSASANTVARRTSDGGVAAIGNNAAGVDGRSIHHVGVYGESEATSGSGVSGYSPTTGTGVTGVSASGSGGQSTSMGGTYHHRFGTKSAIDRLSGILKFVDSTAASDRAAQRTELGLGSAALAATEDFDTAGEAATAQAYAVQRANHTGTQTLSTISDAGTMAAQTAANYYAKPDFSASPTAAEPLKADGSGGVQAKKLAVGAAQHTGSVVSAHYNAGASLAFFVRESDGKVFWAAPGGFALGGGAYPLSMAWGTNGSITNSSGNLLMYNTAAAAVRIRTTNIDTLVLAADGGATFTPHTSSEIGIVVSLAAAAIANALEVRSSVGTVLAKIEPDGEVQAAGYKSSDGSAGWTGTFINGSGATVTVKNGLITGVA